MGPERRRRDRAVDLYYNAEAFFENRKLTRGGGFLSRKVLLFIGMSDSQILAACYPSKHSLALFRTYLRFQKTTVFGVLSSQIGIFGRGWYFQLLVRRQCLPAKIGDLFVVKRRKGCA